MITLRTLIAIAFVFLAGILPAEDGSPEVGTWELVSMEMTKREGQEYPVHRLILTADGRYLNSATRGGPIAVNYRVKKADDSPGWFDFLLQVPSEKEFGRGAGLRLESGKLVMSYRDGRVVTYSRVSEVADEALLVSPEGKNITIQPNKNEAEQDGTGQPATRPESKSEGGDKPQPEAEGRAR
jgi:hypothetical protein